MPNPSTSSPPGSSDSAATMPTAGSASGATAAATNPGSTNRSLLTSTIASARPAAAPAFTARPNPRFSPGSMSVTSGKRPRTIAAVPSLDALSITITRSPGRQAVRRCSRQVARWSRVLNATTTTSAVIASGRRRPAAAPPRQQTSSAPTGRARARGARPARPPAGRRRVCAPVAGGEQRSGGAVDLRDRPARRGHDRHVGGQRLGQHHPELLLPVRRRQRREHEARRVRVDGRQRLVGDPSAELDAVGDAEVACHAPQALLLGACAHDQRAHVVAAQPRERPQHVLVALLPHQPADREHEVAAVGGRGRRAGGREALDVDPGRRECDPVGRRALQQQRVAGSLGGGQVEVGGPQRGAAVAAGAHVAVGVGERQRLPHGERQPKAEPLAQPRRLRAEPVAQLGGVHDVGAAERVLQAEVALADGAGGERRQPGADGPYGLPAHAQRGGVVRVVGRLQDAHVVVRAEVLEGAQVPGVDRGPAQDDHAARGGGRRLRHGATR